MYVRVPARRQCATQASYCGTVSSCWGAVLVLWPGGECLWSWVLCDRHSTTDAAQHGDGFADGGSRVGLAVKDSPKGTINGRPLNVSDKTPFFSVTWKDITLKKVQLPVSFSIAL